MLSTALRPTPIQFGKVVLINNLDQYRAAAGNTETPLSTPEGIANYIKIDPSNSATVESLMQAADIEEAEAEGLLAIQNYRTQPTVGFFLTGTDAETLLNQFKDYLQDLLSGLFSTNKIREFAENVLSLPGFLEYLGDSTDKKGIYPTDRQILTQLNNASIPVEAIRTAQWQLGLAVRDRSLQHNPSNVVSVDISGNDETGWRFTKTPTASSA